MNDLIFLERLTVRPDALVSEYTGLLHHFRVRIPEPVRFWLFTGVAGAILVAVIGYLATRGAIRAIHGVAFSLVAAGLAGILVDEYIHEGLFIELFRVRIGSFQADLLRFSESAIVAGVCLLIISLFRGRRRRT